MEPNLTILDNVGTLWIVSDHLGSFGTILTTLSHSHLEPFGVILEPFGAIWSQLTVSDGTQDAS